MVARSCCVWIGIYCAELGAECTRWAGGDADVDGGKQRGGWDGDGYRIACMVHAGRRNTDRGVLSAAGYGEFADAGICGEQRQGDVGGSERHAALAGAGE